MCLDVPKRGPVPVCANGHVVCSKCLRLECPTCRSLIPMGFIARAGDPDPGPVIGKELIGQVDLGPGPESSKWPPKKEKNSKKFLAIRVKSSLGMAGGFSDARIPLHLLIT